MQEILSTIAEVIAATYAVWVALGSVLAMRKLLHYLQLESYQLPGYYKSVKRNFAKSQLPGTVLAIVCLMVRPLSLSALCALAVGALGHVEQEQHRARERLPVVGGIGHELVDAAVERQALLRVVAL